MPTAKLLAVKLKSKRGKARFCMRQKCYKLGKSSLKGVKDRLQTVFFPHDRGWRACGGIKRSFARRRGLACDAALQKYVRKKTKPTTDYSRRLFAALLRKWKLKPVAAQLAVGLSSSPYSHTLTKTLRFEKVELKSEIAIRKGPKTFSNFAFQALL